MMKAIVSSVLAAVVTVAVSGAQQPRDAAVRLPAGTGTIAGMVVSDDDPPKPMRGAIVTLSHVDKGYADTTITDELGRYSFRQVPDGRYLLGATSAGFVTLRHGATRPGRAGTPLALGDGEQRDGLALTLIRGAALTGTIRLANGDPAEGAQVHVQRVVSGPGGPRYVDSWESAQRGMADDRGVFRLFELVEGDYVIQAYPQLHHMPGASAVLPTRSVDVRWARARMQGASADAGDGGPPPDRRTVSLVPVFFPGVLDRESATVVSLARGEVRAGLDMTLQMVSSYRVTGTVSVPSGALASGPHVFMVESRPDGMDLTSAMHGGQGTSFTMSGVTPGAYTLIAVAPEEKLFAMVDVRVSNQDLHVALTLQAGLAMTGRVVFSGSGTPPDLQRLRLYLDPVGTGIALGPVPATVGPDGSFGLDGLMPGRYRVAARVDGQSPWSLRSAMVGDRDLAIVPADITAAMAGDPIVVTFTDRPTELAGRLEDAAGRPASDYFIVVFSADERAWFEGSKGIAQTRPASDGEFSIRGLPPGDYYLAAVTDVERDEWFDPIFLRELVPSAVRLPLPEGGRVVHALRIGR
jgi:hypothetical protein